MDSESKKVRRYCQEWVAKIRTVLSNITVEPILMCFVLPCIMANLATQNLNMDKACRVNLKLDDGTCDAMVLRDTERYNQSDEVAVQKLVATMNAWKNVIQSFVPSLLLMFLGSWSDRHRRRKPCFLGPIIGEMVTCMGLLFCTFFYYELPVEYNVFFEAVPPSLTGGWFAMFMAIFSYIGGITSVQTRTLRIGAVNIFVNISFTVGNALSGILYKHIGFYGIFSLALLFYLVGFCYGVFVVKEIPSEGTTIGTNFLKDFFNVKHVAETFRVAFKKGKRNRKARICTMMVLCMVIVGPMHGEVSVLYLFVRYRFGWNEVDYSIYSTFYVITHMLGTLFSLILFSKILKIDDAALGFLSSASRIVASVVYAFAPNAWVFYAGALIEILNGTTFIAMRSIISKLVPPDELGKINSLFGLSEALVPIVYGPLYSIVYKHTISSLPGTFFLVGGALTVPSLFIFCWLYNEHKRDREEDAISDCNKTNL
ncbi:probable peptidoglycan muropeptide transporter SLC46 [Zophobas morio]|uniref:probable peptidoglycan muropeptide transporter SLC46 n=1 Tax=Zophobas morio TaxID=2755281 RepID=UPI0030831799